jgi:hypothetical protein
MNPLYLPLIGLLALYELWILYVFVMALKRAKNAGLLSKTAKFFGTPVLITGYLLDAFVNVFVMTLVLLEPPRELTVTARLKRHIKTSQGWRLRVALWFVSLLDPYDPSGRHVTEEPAP